MKEMTYEEALQAIPKGKYRHFKGNEYEIVCIARDCESTQPLVVYKALYGDGMIWVRPAEYWYDQITRNGQTYTRFTRIADEGET